MNFHWKDTKLIQYVLRRGSKICTKNFCFCSSALHPLLHSPKLVLLKQNKKLVGSRWFYRQHVRCAQLSNNVLCRHHKQRSTFDPLYSNNFISSSLLIAKKLVLYFDVSLFLIFIEKAFKKLSFVLVLFSKK